MDGEHIRELERVLGRPLLPEELRLLRLARAVDVGETSDSESFTRGGEAIFPPDPNPQPDALS